MSPPTSTPSMAEGGWPPPVLDAAGPFAQLIQTLSWTLIAMAAAVLAVVIAALVVALFGGPALRRRLGGERAILIGGIAFPVVVLTGILVYGLSATTALSRPPQPGELRIRVTGEMWWWRVAYLDAAGREAVQTANEIRIPAGRPVAFELQSGDVIHSFWVPRLAGKLDMIPGRRNVLRLQADAPGVYRGQCAEYCGGPHALMGLVVVALPPAEFEAWLAREAAPAAPPGDAMRAQGLAVFRRNACDTCHTVRGAQANGLAGPDLTHVGARTTIGAGILPNNQGTLAGWVANNQALKPGVRMPNYDTLTGVELRALAAYLEGLK